ncbi:MAG: tetratricopeptide repeat protein [bacterium]|nr:tetratricopeptide repeat protein [bacterium]
MKDGKYVSYFGENNPCLVRFGTQISDRKANEVELLLGKSAKTAKTEITVPANYFYSHGNILYKLKRYKESIQQYVEVIRRDPNHGGAYNNLANLFYLAGKKDTASLCLNQAEACGFKVNPRFKKVLE